MNNHILHGTPECPCTVSDRDCFICNGGLAACVACGGGEGSLPSECPGVRMTATQSDDVYNGRTDFREGRWIKVDHLADLAAFDDFVSTLATRIAADLTVVNPDGTVTTLTEIVPQRRGQVDGSAP